MKMLRLPAILRLSALVLAISGSFGCATANSNSSAVDIVQQKALDEKLFMYGCDELAGEAKTYYASKGFEERKKGLAFGPNGLSLRGGSSFESSTSASSETKISLFGGESETETKVETRGTPDVSFVTEEFRGEQKLFTCWDHEEGAQLELKTIRDETIDKAARAYEDELEFMKLVDEDGYDELMAGS